MRTTTNVRVGVERRVEVFAGVATLVTMQRRIQRGQRRSEDEDGTSRRFLRKNTVSERRILGESKTHLPDKVIRPVRTGPIKFRG